MVPVTALHEYWWCDGRVNIVEFNRLSVEFHKGYDW
jgi:hypothetical protein